MITILKKPDAFGLAVSTLCILHCFLTPFLFVIHSYTDHANSVAPLWWSSLDYLFLIVSFFAVLRATRTSTNATIKKVLWISWILLVISILNEKIEIFHLPETAIYVPASSLILFHWYNLKYCQCKIENDRSKNG